MLTVGGSPFTNTGIVSIPSAFSSVGAGAGVNGLLQSYLDGISTSIAGGPPVLSLFNNDIAAGTTYSVAGSGGSVYEEITNTDSVGGTVAGGGVYRGLVVPATVVDLVVEVPGKSVITGNGATSLALVGANSNVNYTDTNGGTALAADSIFAAGGKDTINTYGTGANVNSSYNITVTGDDTVNIGASFDSVTADGNASTTVYIYNGATTVTANDSSAVSVQFGKNVGGSLDFINNSSSAATIFSGNYVGGSAPNSVTAYGGAGGGYLVGGRAGGNSLVGGTGAVTLQGAGANDFLEGNSSVGNVMFAGTGNETLLASSTSGSNTFQLGLSYTGSTGAIIANAVVSTAGSGQQAFILGSSSNSTLTGSSATGASNLYIFVSNAATAANGPNDYTITDFSSVNSSLYLNDTLFGSTNTLSIFSETNVTTPIFSGAVITLSDGSTIKLAGVDASTLTSVQGAGYVQIT